MNRLTKEELEELQKKLGSKADVDGTRGTVPTMGDIAALQKLDRPQPLGKKMDMDLYK